MHHRQARLPLQNSRRQGSTAESSVSYYELGIGDRGDRSLVPCLPLHVFFFLRKKLDMVGPSKDAPATRLHSLNFKGTVLNKF